MSLLRAIIGGFRALLIKEQSERELDEELHSYLELAAAEKMNAGMSREKALRSARLEMGCHEGIKEEVRSVGWESTIESLWQDTRYAMRILVKHKSFSIVAILALALGIGAATAFFSVVDAVLLRPLPWPSADRLVTIHAVLPHQRNDPAFATTWNRAPISWAAWQDLRRTAAFEEVGAWFTRSQILGDARADLVEVMHASCSYLSLLGARPELGRLFTPDEDHADSQAVVLSHEAWLRHFGGRSDILGQTAKLAPGAQSRGVDRTIVGVLPRGFRFPGVSPEFLMPMGQWAYIGSFEASRFLRALGRLAPGVSLDAASTVAEPAVRRLESPERRSARLISIVDEQVGGAARPLWLMLAGAGLLLLLACANVAGLLLGEVRVRRHEFAVRAALGGSRRRVLRQLAIEHLLLALMAGGAGVVVAIWLTRSLVAMAPALLPGIESVGVDFRIAAFAVCLSLGTALLFGLAPAAALSSIRLTEALSEGRREATPRGPAAQRAIVAGQFGLALVLLVCANLFGESVIRLASQPLGFNPSNLAVVSIRLTQYPRSPAPAIPRAALGTVEAVTRAREALDRHWASGWIHTAGALQRLSALPGVIAVAGVGTAPFTGGLDQATIRAYGRPPEDGQAVHQQIVTDRYFKAMGMPILRGRSFGPSDRQGSSAVVVSSELERRFFAGNAVGKRLVKGVEPTTVYEVIGVVPNARQREFADDDLATVYVLDRAFGSVNHFIIRTSGDATAVLPIIRQTIRGYDKSMVVTSTITMDQLLAASIAEERFRALLSAVFGGAALVLAAIGLYGMAARRVAERRREIGIRIALGARPADVRLLVLRDAWVIACLGVLGGLPAALAASQVTRTFLFGVSPTAPHIFLIASGVLTAVAIIATLVPAHRASLIDPMLTLRE